MIHATMRGGSLKLLVSEQGQRIRKRRWAVIVEYDDLDGHHKRVIRQKQKCYISELSQYLPSGPGIWNVSWEAKGK